MSIDQAEAPITSLLRGSEAVAEPTDHDHEVAGVGSDETDKPREPLINVSVQG